MSNANIIRYSSGRIVRQQTDRMRRYSKRVSNKPPVARYLWGKPGQILKASDRIYLVTSNGNLVRGYISPSDGKFHQQRRVRNSERRRRHHDN